MRPEAQLLTGDAIARVPGKPFVAPVLMTTRAVCRWDEELKLHQLELSCAEDEVAGCDLVSECLPELGDPERRPAPRGGEDVEDVHEHALSRVVPEVGNRRGAFDRSGVGWNHEVDGPGLCQVLGAAIGARVLDLVRAPS